LSGEIKPKPRSSFQVFKTPVNNGFVIKVHYVMSELLFSRSLLTLLNRNAG
jgi:hypothetical protein